jgi:hypothetical protein
VRRPRTEAGEHRVGSGDRRLDLRRVRQVGGDEAHQSGELLRVRYDCCEVVACGDGLLEEVPTDTAGRRRS